MSKRTERKKRLDRYPWGNGSPSSQLDFSLLKALSSVASSFEGSAAPNSEQLESLSTVLREEIDNFTREKEPEETNMIEAPIEVPVDENSNSSASNNKTTAIKRRSRNKSVDIVPGTEKSKDYDVNDFAQHVVEKVDLSKYEMEDSVSRDRAKEFFGLLQRQYGPKYQQVVKSFVDSLQRFLRAEISEMALLSILRYLFSDTPEILNKFDEFTQLNLFQSNASDEINRLSLQGLAQYGQSSYTDNKLDDKSVPGVVPRLGVAAYSNKAMKQLSQVNQSLKRPYVEMSGNLGGPTMNVAQQGIPAAVAQDDGDSARLFLRKIKSCVDILHYQKIVDLLLELRQSFRNNALIIQSNENIQRLQIIRTLLPPSRDDLRSQLDLLFPVVDATMMQEEALQESLATHLGMSGRMYDRNVMAQNTNAILNNLINAQRVGASMQQYRGGYAGLSQRYGFNDGNGGNVAASAANGLPNMYLNRNTDGNTVAAYTHGNLDSNTAKLLQQAQIQQQLNMRAQMSQQYNVRDSLKNMTNTANGLVSMHANSNNNNMNNNINSSNSNNNINNNINSSNSNSIPVNILKSQLENAEVFERLQNLENNRNALSFMNNTPIDMESDNLPPMSATIETELKLRKSLGSNEKSSDPWNDLLTSGGGTGSSGNGGVNKNSDSSGSNNSNNNNNIINGIDNNFGSPNGKSMSTLFNAAMTSLGIKGRASMNNNLSASISNNEYIHGNGNNVGISNNSGNNGRRE